MKTAPNALRMTELFFYKFFEVAAALHRAALQLSMKNMRELKLRLEGNLHTKYEAAARHGIPVTGTAGCINNVGTLGIHLVKQIVDLSVDIDILRRCIACTHVEDSIIIGNHK